MNHPSKETGVQTTERPNILVFLADDLGWGDLGCYGASAIPTQNIDRLATRGMLFTDAHASSAVCTPSRYSLLTGRYPWRSPLKDGVLGGTDPSIIKPGLPTLATSLVSHGYRTGAFGKWHLGLDWRTLDGRRPSAFDPGFKPDMQASGREIDYARSFTGGPLDHGFERFFGIAGSLDMPPYCFLDQDRTVGIPSIEKTDLVTSQRPGLQVPDWEDDRTDPTVLSRATEWISDVAASGSPFFAYVASAAPHRPCVPPEFMRGRSQAGARGDSVCLVDWMVGELIDALEGAGALENTVVVFTSDNGAPMIFPEDGDVEDHRPNGAWRGQKADAWEGGHRIPLIVAGPAVRVGANSEVVSLLDVLPTVVGLVGADDPAERDGRSLTGLLRGTDVEAADRVLGQQAFDGSLALRQGPHKVIFSSGSGGFSEPIGEPCDADSDEGQYYDLGEDPGESHNLWSQRRQRAAGMLERFTSVTGFPSVRGERG